MNKNITQITRSKLDRKEVLNSVQKCYDLSHSSLIVKTIKLSIINFHRAPLNLIICLAILTILTLSVNYSVQITLFNSILVTFASYSILFVAYVSYRCYFGWKEFINHINAHLDLSHKWASQIYDKENNAMFTAVPLDSSNKNELVVAHAAILVGKENNEITSQIIPDFSDIKNDTQALITRVGVLPHYHGKGIGRDVVQACIEFAKLKNVKTIKLTTSSSQMAAVGLYKSLGFKIVAVETVVAVFRFEKIKMELNL
jgi:GNAT superfamily N-acetyltransferase